MNHDDVMTIVRELGPSVRKMIDAATAPLRAEIEVLKARPIPKDGASIAGAIKGADGVLFLTLTDGAIVKTDLRDGRDGKDGVPGERGEKGDAGEKGEQGPPGPKGDKGEAGPEGPAGIPGEPGAVGEPGPQGVQGERGLTGEKGEPGPAGKDGADGRDGKDGAPGERGERGEKGEPGRDGKEGPAGAKGDAGRDGRDGSPGRDGKDGFGFDDLNVELAEDQRTVVHRFRKGETVKEFRTALPVVIDRGVFKEGSAYAKGDGVTYGGSFWIAQRDTGERPEASDAWRLAVKRGRDGKDGAKGDPGASAEELKAGRKLR